jgi:hypothetical protein
MKSAHRFILFISIVSIALLNACKKQDAAPDMAYSYFDLTHGRYIIYDAVKISHDAAQAINDTLYYQMKTVIGDTIIDNEGRVANRYLRFIRNTELDPWVLQDIYTTIIENRRAELVEENQRVIKLVFAPTLSKSWNANAFNMLPTLNCYYRAINKKATIGALSFDSTLVVEQADFSSLIGYERKYEVYAKGVGMVYKYYKDLDIANFDTLNVKKGEELFLTINSYGIE